jgi:hypothetical protein
MVSDKKKRESGRRLKRESHSFFCMIPIETEKVDEPKADENAEEAK